MYRILVTGGNGYVGSRLIKKLKYEGYSPESYDLPDNILDEKKLREKVENVDIVYHLAALPELKYTNEHPEDTFDVNILGTHNLCKICAENDILLNFVSTSCIYGEPLEYPSKENGLINPTDTYAMSKAAGEYVVKMWHLSKGLYYNILRLGTVYGVTTDKTLRGDMAIQKFINNILEGKPITVYGDGKQSRNFIHINDVVDGFVAILDRQIVRETLNIAGKERVSINEVISILRNIVEDVEGKLGLIQLEVKYDTERKDDFRNQHVLLEKVRRLTGWQPRVRFEEGLIEMYKAIRNERK
jgi:UDP-glucose 4-epimerase